MFLESFKISVLAVAQIFILGAVGYFLMKKDILGEVCLDILSRLTIDVTLPILIFCQLLQGFSFSLYKDWWIFPLLSIAITALGFAAGFIFSIFIPGKQHKLQFVSLVAFQNSGYLPLALIAALLPADKINTMFIYLFLFLAGFNLVMWSVGVHMLSSSAGKKFELGSLFSPPVIATLLGLAAVLVGLNKVTPAFILKPMRMIGDCTLPLSMLVVGGSLAQIHLGRIDKRAIFFLALAKLILLPLIGLAVISRLRLPELLGLLMIIQLAMPPATSLSLIIRHYKKEDLLINQGIFFGHLFSIVSLPVFLSFYFMSGVIQ